MRTTRKAAGHPILFTVLLVVAVYVVISGAVSLSTDHTCAFGWQAKWRAFPPGWECQRDFGR